MRDYIMNAKLDQVLVRPGAELSPQSQKATKLPGFVLLCVRVLVVNLLLGRGSCLRFLLTKFKSPPNDHFQNQMISTAGQSNAHTKIEFPFRRHVQINCRKDLMLLLALWIELAKWSKSAVILDSGIDFLCY